jgi:hypothetical protein
MTACWHGNRSSVQSLDYSSNVGWQEQQNILTWEWIKFLRGKEIILSCNPTCMTAFTWSCKPLYNVQYSEMIWNNIFTLEIRVLILGASGPATCYIFTWNYYYHYLSEKTIVQLAFQSFWTAYFINYTCYI